MSELLLPSLAIEHFRAFQELRIPHLGRVNVIVGKNNCGKTTLLEGLWLYAQRGRWSALWDVLERRREGMRPQQSLTTPDVVDAQVRAYAHLFYNRADIATDPPSIRIGTVGHSYTTLTISPYWRAQAPSDQRELAGLVVTNSGAETIYPFDYGQRATQVRERLTSLPIQFVETGGVDTEMTGALWDAITLTEREDEVIRALQIIEPRVQRVNLRVDMLLATHGTTRSPRETQRAVIVRLHGADEQVRLTSLGDGMNRLFGIALALVNTPNGLLLVDEIENGLHFSVLPALWTLIFQLAARLNIQVFATTHSWDCIEAFQMAAHEHPASGCIVKLHQSDTTISATVFDEDEIAMIARNQIEVR